MSHRLQKMLLAAAGSIFITLTFSALSASAAEDSTEVLETTTLNRFVVSDGGNRVLVGSVSSDAVTQAGWYVTDDGSIYYYYEDGTYAQEETILADGYTYVFSTDGVLETGWQTVDGKRYYYNTEVGTPMFGWLTYLNQSYYVDENEGKLIGEQEIDGTRYSFDNYGCVQIGLIRYSDGVLYYYDDDLNVVTGWVEENGLTYYMTENGAVTGLQIIDNNTYYFDTDGSMYCGWQFINDNWYFFGTDGTMQTGWVNVDNKTYYFDADGIMQSGWLTIDGSKYYFDDNGEMQTGLVTIDGDIYFFGTDGIMQTGWISVNDNKYYFGSDGVAQTGWVEMSGNTYYFNTSGEMQTGWVTISGSTYYFSTSGIMQSGWITVSGCTYYLNTNGVMQTGWLTLDGNTYYFNASGVMQTGLKTIDSAQYYFNASGVMQTGWITISGTSYYFDTTTGELTNTGHAAVQLDVPDYKQFDSQWANTTITYSTIGKVGCLATSIAMKYSYETGTSTTPDKILSLLTFSGDSLQWVSFTNLGYTMEQPGTSVTQSVMQTIYTQLSEGTPVIVGAKTSSGGQHWIVVTGYTGSTGSSFSTSNFVINDPGSSSRTTLSEYLAVYPKLYMIVY